MRKIILFLFLIILICRTLPISAQNAVSGYEFLFGILENNTADDESEVFVTITSAENAHGKITVASANWFRDFSVPAGGQVVLKVPYGLVRHNNAGNIDNKSIRITSDKKISAFAANASDYTTDATHLMPVQHLGNNYMVLNFPGYNHHSNDVLIVSASDDTQVEIKPSCKTSDNRAAYIPFTIRLNEGETYLLRSAENNDLTGTKIKSFDCKNIAVFSGAKGANIPIQCSAVDHIYAQIPALNRLGKRYLLSPLNGTYTCKILSTENNTRVFINGNLAFILNEGQSHVFINQSNSMIIETDKPAMAAQFLQGTLCSSGGDPAMIILSPEEEFYSNVNFSAPALPNIAVFNVAIVTKSSNASSVKLDGIPVGEFSSIGNSTQYSFKIVPISSGAHTLEAAEGFSAMVWATGWANSYLYNAGIKDHLNFTAEFERKSCVGSEIEFSCSAENLSSVSWDFGNNQRSVINPAIQSFPNAGNHPILLTVDIGDGCPIVLKDSIQVLSYPEYSLPKNIVICGDGEVFIQKEGNFTYNWSNGDNNNFIKTSNEGLYSLTTSNGICSINEEVKVTRTPYPQVVEISSDTTIYINNAVALNASGGTHFSWSPGTSLSCTECPNPVAAPRETTTYQVTISDNLGCMALDSVTVFVEKDLRVLVPNIFSPNNDGQNDVLYVRGKGIRSMKFLIYNRWGEKVFESNNPTIGWDGTFRGSQLQPAVFVYLLEAELESGERVKQKGDITLIR
jgi:gliding motility-associated-like protein